MRNIIQFLIQKGEDGYYIAEGQGFPIFTQAKTIDELVKNISEATELYIEVAEEDENNSFSKHPSILMNYEIPFNRQYA